MLENDQQKNKLKKELENREKKINVLRAKLAEEKLKKKEEL